MRGEKLANRTPIQAFNVQLQNGTRHWVRVVLNPETSEVEYLFWINDSAMAMLKTNAEI